MRTLSLDALPSALSGLPANPRVVVSGNFATPHAVLAAARLRRRRLPPARAQRPGRAARPRGRRRSRPLRRPGHAPQRPPGLHPVAALARAAAVRDHLPARRRPRAHVSLPGRRQGVARHRGQHPPGRDRGGPARGALVIAQVNPQMPYTFGDAEIAGRRRRPARSRWTPTLPSPPPMTIDDVSAEIGRRVVAALVQDGSTLQLGIGAVPDAVLSGLTDRRGLRGLERDVQRRRARPRPRRRARRRRAARVVVPVRLPRALLAGSTATSACSMLRTETTNEPSLIAQQPRDDLGQHRAAGRPLRPGERLAGEGPDLLRLRRPDRLHRRRPALDRRPGDHRAALLAPARRTSRRSCR